MDFLEPFRTKKVKKTFYLVSIKGMAVPAKLRGMVLKSTTPSGAARKVVSAAKKKGKIELTIERRFHGKEPKQFVYKGWRKALGKDAVDMGDYKFKFESKVKRIFR